MTTMLNGYAVQTDALRDMEGYPHLLQLLYVTQRFADGYGIEYIFKGGAIKGYSIFLRFPAGGRASLYGNDVQTVTEFAVENICQWLAVTRRGLSPKQYKDERNRV